MMMKLRKKARYLGRGINPKKQRKQTKIKTTKYQHGLTEAIEIKDLRLT